MATLRPNTVGPSLTVNAHVTRTHKNRRPVKGKVRSLIISTSRDGRHDNSTSSAFLDNCEFEILRQTPKPKHLSTDRNVRGCSTTVYRYVARGGCLTSVRCCAAVLHVFLNEHT